MLASALLVIVLALMGANVLVQRRLARRDALRTARPPATPDAVPASA